MRNVLIVDCGSPKDRHEVHRTREAYEARGDETMLLVSSGERLARDLVSLLARWIDCDVAVFRDVPEQVRAALVRSAARPIVDVSTHPEATRDLVAV